MAFTPSPLRQERFFLSIFGTAPLFTCAEMMDIFFLIFIVLYIAIVIWDMLRNISCIPTGDVAVKAIPVLTVLVLAAVNLLLGPDAGKMMRLSSYVLMADVIVMHVPFSYEKSSGQVICLWTAAFLMTVFLILRTTGLLPEPADAALPLASSALMSLVPFFKKERTIRYNKEYYCPAFLFSAPAWILFVYGTCPPDGELGFDIITVVLLGVLTYMTLKKCDGKLLCPHPPKKVAEPVINAESRTGGEPDGERRMDEMFDRLEKYMLEKEPFLNENLSLAELAAEMYTNKTYLSRTINLKSGKNYCQYINQYRVNYAVQVIKKDRRVKVIELAMISGFHSVASFNMAFRLFMGDTPSEYMRTLQATGFYDP